MYFVLSTLSLIKLLPHKTESISINKSKHKHNQTTVLLEKDHGFALNRHGCYVKYGHIFKVSIVFLSLHTRHGHHSPRCAIHPDLPFLQNVIEGI